MPSKPADKSPRVLLVAEHASAKFGGEAALPLHYFRVLRQRRCFVKLITHARTRRELVELFGETPDIHYVEDSGFHKLMYRVGLRMPARVAYLTVGFASRFSVQLAQRRLIRRLIDQGNVDVVHQPMPVSPREPSMLFGFGVPVVVGPMNGGLDYPPAFRRAQSTIEKWVVGLGRANASWLNRIMPGKRRAAALVVANQITRASLPQGVCRNVVDLVENGVDLELWHPQARDRVDQESAQATTPTKFVFMGRLVKLKAVDLLLRAFSRARSSAAMELWILGDGPERQRLESIAADLGLDERDGTATGSVEFVGWLTQLECAGRLRQADCLVLPSLLECGGAVVLEAMSMGKPVIATAWGGPLDYLDESCGILVPPASPEALVDGLAGAMTRLAQNAALRQDMGRNGQEKVAREYDWERKVDRMLEIYSDVIAAARPSGTAPTRMVR